MPKETSIRESKDLVFIDVKTTGTSILKDRITKVSLIKYFSNPVMPPIEKCKIINPMYPMEPPIKGGPGIPENELMGAPTFRHVAKSLHGVLKDSDLAGVSITTKAIPFLMAEFLRNEIVLDFNDIMLFDVNAIYSNMVGSSDLGIYAYYFNKAPESDNKDMARVMAIKDIFFKQVELYKDINMLERITKPPEMLDLAGAIKINDSGTPVLSLGRYKGKSIKSLYDSDIEYCDWLIDSELPMETKTKLNMEILNSLHEYGFRTA